MKSLKIAVTALVIAGGTFGAFAFTKANTEKANNKKADLYWFDANNNSYIGHGDKSITGCADSGETPCANGYSQLDDNDQPVGNPELTVNRP